ncbi:MAG: RsmF rRNA methyltransferase first C-terminal domain-containing protein [Anaerolineales bacterium]
MIDNYPPEFKTLIADLLGSDASRFWKALLKPARQGMRINPSKTSLNEIREALPGEYHPLPWTRNGYQLEGVQEAGKHPFHAAGLFYLQEPSAMAPVPVLDPQPGEKVLDLCAAPGGKTTQIQSQMGDKGLLISNDPNPNRVQALARNLERWGGRNSVVLSETAERLYEHFGSYFDRVLVDAPCSGEGTFRSDPGEIKKWSPAFSERTRFIQDEILWFAGKLVRPGGTLVYSTCTFNGHENEEAVANFLETNQNFQLASIPKQVGFSPGIQPNNRENLDFSKTVRIWPHTSCGEGHFIACMTKVSAQGDDAVSYHPPQSTDSEARQIYRDFFDQTLSQTANTRLIFPDNPGIHHYGNRLYWISDGAPDLTGLRVIHWGWWLGTINDRNFVPGPTLASTLSTGDVKKVLELPLDDPRLDIYRRGSPVPLSEQEAGADGWMLITAAGHPLGWGKLRHGRLKSYFPRWLRSI